MEKARRGSARIRLEGKKSTWTIYRHAAICIKVVFDYYNFRVVLKTLPIPPYCTKYWWDGLEGENTTTWRHIFNAQNNPRVSQAYPLYSHSKIAILCLHLIPVKALKDTVKEIIDYYFVFV